MLLRRAVVSASALEDPGLEKSGAGFYNGQLRSARFFFETRVPVILGKMDALTREGPVIDRILESDFGGV